MFLEILRKQLILKRIITQADWDTWKNDIRIDYARDNYFAELKESELLRERIGTLDGISQYVGEYFTKEWVLRNVLKISEEEMKKLNTDVDVENDEKEKEAQAAQQDNPPQNDS